MMWKPVEHGITPICYETLALVKQHKQTTMTILHNLDKDISLDFHLQKLEEAGKIKIEGEIVTFIQD